MTTKLYSIIKEVQNTSSTKEKSAILERNADSTELQNFIKLTFCPTITYDLGKKTYPDYEPDGSNNSLETAFDIIDKLRTRKLTGYAAIEELTKVQNSLDQESAELLQYILLKDARISMGAKTFNKVWKNIVVDIPYQRCSLPDDTLEDKFNKEPYIIQQLKGDGTFAVLNYSWNEMFSRNGSSYPESFVQVFKINTDRVLEGEIVWFPYTDETRSTVSSKPLSREISNGITNSVANGSSVPEEYFPKFLVWNILTNDEWLNHESKNPYEARLEELTQVLQSNTNPHVELIETHKVTSLSEAIEINNGYLSAGLEGSILKLPKGGWKYHTSKEAIKLKLEVDIDMMIESVEEATGKNAGMVGRINVVSHDGKVRCGVNAKGTMEQRTDMLVNFERDFKNKVIVVTANDILWNEGENVYTLFLGRANPSDVRFDKNEADDIIRIREIFESHGIVKDLTK